jgi:phage FluMu protein gp41
MSKRLWRELYEAAVLETNLENMQANVQAAKAAIDARLQELQLDHGGTPEERHAISDALAGLNLLRREIETRSRDTGSDLQAPDQGGY